MCLPISPLSVPLDFNGLDVLLSALAFSIFCIAWNRLRPGTATLLFFFAVVTAMIVNILRIVVFSAIRTPDFLPTIPLQCFVFFMIWQMAKRLLQMQPTEREQ